MQIVDRMDPISELNFRLLRAFGRAEKSHQPPSLWNLWATCKALRVLVVARHLELYEIFPLYAALAMLLLPLGFKSLWLTPLAGTASVAYLLYLEKYRDKFAHYVSQGKVQGQAKFFNVAGVPLLAIGMIKLFKIEKTKSQKGKPVPACAPFTRANLSLAMRFQKLGLDYKDLAFGFSDWARKALFGLLLTGPYWLVQEWAKVSLFLNSGWSNKHWEFVLVLGLLVLYFAAISFSAGFAPINTKRRNLRYLVVLAYIESGWPEGVEVLATPHGSEESGQASVRPKLAPLDDEGLQPA
ncbi:MAG: hypothetical protein M3N82_01310 [Pseudomonadota bacterium]|nr:hypothetical protein [Pseudomonadota bacterium]